MKYFYTTQTVPFFLVICSAILLTGSITNAKQTRSAPDSPIVNSTTYQVTGTLVNNMGEPVAGHGVYLYDENAEGIASDRSDSLGRFLLSYEAEPVSTDPADGPDTGRRTSHQKPSGFNLGSSYPNPFNPRTRIPFQVPEHTTAGLN